MTESELIEAIHKGIYNANKNLETWSKGYFLSDAAAEGFMVTHMAQEIMRHKKRPPYLLLEPSIQCLKDESGRPHPGRPCARTYGLARVDLSVMNSAQQLKFAIEAKCSYAWTSAYDEDMKRLIKMQRSFSKWDERTAMQAGIFAMFVHSYSIHGEEEAMQNLEKKFEKWENRLGKLQEKLDNITIYCRRSTCKKHTWRGEDDEVHCASSLCAVIKSAQESPCA